MRSVSIPSGICLLVPAIIMPLKERLFQADFEKSLELKTPLPAGPGYHLAEALADVFL